MKTRVVIRKQLSQLIGDKMITGGMKQLFNLFFHSTLHIGDTWQDTTREANDLNLQEKTVYTIKFVDDSIAWVKSKCNLGNHNSDITVMGTEITANIGGYKRDIQIQYSGMIVKGNMVIQLEGTNESMGREFPGSIQNTVSVDMERLI